MDEKKLSATKSLKSKIVEWKEQFIKNCKELGDVPFSKCDVGDVNTLWKLKLDEGADAKSMDGYYACIPRVYWNSEIIGFFLSEGCDVNGKDEDGMTALHYAVRYLWEKNDDVIQFLLDKGADPKIRDNNGLIPIFHLSPIFLTSKKPQSIKLFEKISGTNYYTVYTRTRYLDGDTVLHRAVEILDSESLTKFLCDFKGNVDVRGGLGKTPFMFAFNGKKYDICELLLDKGADVNAQDVNGYTALHNIMHYGSMFRPANELYDSINFLMKNNADPNIRSNSGRDDYEVACLRGIDFTEGAKPSKLIQIHEMKGAFAILGEHNYEEGLVHWKEALDICSKYNLKPSLELVSNYELVKKHQKSDDNFKTDLYRAALRTVDRISTGSSKLWNILSGIGCYNNCSGSKISDEELMESLKFINDKLLCFNWEDFVPTETNDLIRFKTFVARLHYLKMKSTDFCFILNFLKFAITFFSKWMEKAAGDDVFYSYYEMCVILMQIQTDDPSSKEWIVEETRNLIKTIVELDPIDCGSEYTLLHLACRNWDRELIEVMIDFGANVQAVNAKRTNQIPIQMIYSEKFKDEQNLSVIKKMIEKGSPINVTNVDGELIEDLLTKYTL